MSECPHQNDSEASPSPLPPTLPEVIPSDELKARYPTARSIPTARQHPYWQNPIDLSAFANPYSSYPNIYPGIPPHSVASPPFSHLAARPEVSPVQKEADKPLGETAKGTGYTIAEDERCCRAYIAVSKDPIVGARQKSTAFWDRIAA